MDIRQIEAEVEKNEREGRQVEEAVLSIVLDGRPTNREELAWIENKLAELHATSQRIIDECIAAILN